MPRRPRNIVRRGDTYYLRKQIDGKLVRKALGPNLAEAKRLAQLEIARWTRRPIDGIDPDGLSVTAVAARWLAEYVKQRRNPKGVDLAVQRLKDHVLPILGALPISSVDSAKLVQVREGMEGKKLAVNTVRHVLADVRCLLGWATEERLLARTPFRPKLLMPKSPEEVPRDLTDEQVEQIIAAVSPRSAFAVKLALFTGCRWGELHALTWSRVRLGSQRCLEIEHTKSGKVRRVPLVPEAIALLEAERVRQRQDGASSMFVLVNRGRNPGNFVQRSWKRLDFRWHFHQLRHTAARRWLEAGGSLATLQLVLGHSTSRMTERYAKLTDRHVAEEAARIGFGSGHTGGHIVEA